MPNKVKPSSSSQLREYAREHDNDAFSIDDQIIAGREGTSSTAAAATEERAANGSNSRERPTHSIRVRFDDNGHANGRCEQWLRVLDRRLPSTAVHLVATVAAVAVAWFLLQVNLTRHDVMTSVSDHDNRNTTTADLMAVPGGSVASMFILYVVAVVAGRLTSALGDRLPPLLGMIVAGIALQNYGLYTVTDDWCVRLVAVMREAALSVILVKGGLELNAKQLRQHSSAVIRLALLPCIAEAVAAGVIAHYVFSNFSLEWGLALGFTLSAVSPAVLVPSLSKLKKMGLGEENGVNTLVIAASSLDDIISISGFGVVMSIVFSTGDLASKIRQGPVDVGIGIALGLVWGFFLIFVPPSPWAEVYKKDDDKNKENTESQTDRSITAVRSFLLGAGGVLAVTGSPLYGFPGAGPLACIVSSFVAANGWRWRAKVHNRNCDPPTFPSLDDVEANDRDKDDSVEKVLESIWYGLQPILFASIGTEIKFKLFRDGDVISAGLLIIGGGLIVRTIVTTCSLYGTQLNSKEMTFINVAWLPKATVQAALAPVALDMVKSLSPKSDIHGNVENAMRLLTIAVISILVTAPIGALGIQFFGPILLSKSKSSR